MQSNPWGARLANFEFVIVGFLILGLIFVCFGRALDYGILYWDSYRYIIENTCIQGQFSSTIKCVFSQVYFSNWHPLTSLTYALEYYFVGDQPRAYHATNLVLHAVNCMLLYTLARKIFSLLDVARRTSIVGAAFASLLFAIHPQHVESVVWIAERKGLLSTLFFFLSTIFYIEYVKAKPQQRGLVPYLLSILFCFLSLMSKSMIVTMPVLLLLVDVYPLKRIDLRQKISVLWSDLRPLLYEKIPFVLASLVLVVVTIYAQFVGESIAGLDSVDLETRLVNAIYTLLFYCVKWAIPLGLSPYYSHPEFIATGNVVLMLFCVFLFVAFVGFLLYWALKRSFIPLVLFLFYAVALSPVIGVIQVGTQGAADRYTYLSLFPLYIIAGFCVASMSMQGARVRRFCAGLSGAFVLISFGFITIQQVKIWRSDLHLWTYVNSSWIAADRLPHNVKTLQVMGLAESYYRIGDYDNALKYYLMIDASGPFFEVQYYIHFARSYSFLGMDNMALQIYQHMLKDDDLEAGMEKLVRADLELLEKRMAEAQD